MSRQTEIDICRELLSLGVGEPRLVPEYNVPDAMRPYKENNLFCILHCVSYIYPLPSFSSFISIVLQFPVCNIESFFILISYLLALV